ncbi:uncharacterized, partial [Tachysurus ichikawai]
VRRYLMAIDLGPSFKAANGSLFIYTHFAKDDKHHTREKRTESPDPFFRVEQL